jgi:hypothetical protein
MPFSGAQDTSNTQAAKNLVENDPRRIQIHGVMPTQGINGGVLVYPRVPALKPAQVVDACQPADDISTAVAPIRFGMVEYVARVPVCMAHQDIFKHPNDIVDINVTIAEIQNWYGYYGRMDVATGNPSLGGLPDLVAPSRIVDMGGAPLSFPCLSRAYHLVTANNGKPSVIMSNARSLESYENLCRLNGQNVERLPWRWYCPATRRWIQGRSPELQRHALGDQRRNEPRIAARRPPHLVHGPWRRWRQRSHARTYTHCPGRDAAQPVRAPDDKRPA